MTQKIDYAQVAMHLVGGNPLDYKVYQDGLLVVIAPDGKKLSFTDEQVREALPKPGSKSNTHQKVLASHRRTRGS